MQIGFITVLGGLLRLFGLLHGLQENFLYHPDTVITLNEVWPKYLGEGWLSGSYNGAFYNLLLSYMIGIIETLIRFLGYSPGPWSIEQISSIASLFAATLGTATIPVVYLLGRETYNEKSGVIAAILLSFCPLHSFQSHYPYRDIPMVFFLTLTLLFCIKIIKKPTLLTTTLGGIAAIITVGMKPAGLVIIVPMLVALTIAIYQARRRWWVFLPIGVMIGWGFIFFSQGGVSSRFTTTGNLIAFLLETQQGIFRGMVNVVKLLNQWLGLPYLLASLVGIGYGFWLRRVGDIILLTFLLPAFLAAAFYLWLDERFLVFLLPAMAVLVGRFIAESWQRWFNKKILKAALLFVTVGLTFYAFMTSTWQGILFSLPDTRAVSGRWLEAHFPKTIRVAMEEYFPLGVNSWPKASFYNPLQPLEKETAGVDLLVTSSLMHQRFLLAPDRYPKELNFYSSLQRERPLIKKFSLGSHGFIHPNIGIYSPYSVNTQAPYLFIPRPYDSKWNFGLSFLDQGPFDRDDRTIQLGWGHRYTATLVSPITGQEMMVFMINGPEKSVVQVRVGGQTKTRTLKPGEFHIISFHPKWVFPQKPALYYFETGLSQGKKVLLQLRCGNREIGQSLANWGLNERAIPYLKKAIGENSPYKAELNLLLGSVYKKLGKLGEARETIDRLIKSDHLFVQHIRSLGQRDQSDHQWESEFRKYTGLDPELLTYALSQEFHSGQAFPGLSGQIVKNCQALGGETVVYEKARHKAGEVMHGPYLYLEQGAFEAEFFFRAWDDQGTKPFAVIKVLADDQVISTASVKRRIRASKGKYFEVTNIPFWHPDPRAEIKFQVLATGQSSFAVEKIRIKPDLKKLFQKKWEGFKAIKETLRFGG